jgi:hypothetical protein
MCPRKSENKSITRKSKIIFLPEFRFSEIERSHQKRVKPKTKGYKLIIDANKLVRSVKEKKA